MADMEKPVILLVHGAWHNPGHLRELTADIQAEGFTVLTPSLATAGFGDSIDTASQLDDARRLTDAVKPHLEQGKNVVGIAHSYGAFPLAHAINGLTAKERANKGLKGGFSAAIFIAPMPTFQSGVSAVEASVRIAFAQQGSMLANDDRRVDNGWETGFTHSRYAW